jgi:hypothetical protein
MSKALDQIAMLSPHGAENKATTHGQGDRRLIGHKNISSSSRFSFRVALALSLNR